MNERQTIGEQALTKEKLPDEKLGNLLAFVGNHEGKAIVLILMGDRNVYDKHALHRKVLDAQGNNKGWEMDHNTPFAYCVKSFAPIGLVKKYPFTFGYSITQEGVEFGIPLAGLLLNFSERHQIPLNLLFGRTGPGSKKETKQTEIAGNIPFKKRAPITTLKILYELLTSPSLPIREVDLGKEIAGNNPEDLGTHLIRLSKLRLIEYKSKEANRPFSQYQLSSNIQEGEQPMHAHFPTLTRSVLNVFERHPNRQMTIGDIYRLLPQEQREGKKKKSFLSNLSSVLSFLKKHGYIDVGMFHEGKASEINITGEQRAILTELFEIICRFQDKDGKILERGKQLAKEIISDPKRVSIFLDTIKNTSANANASPLKETKTQILSIISRHSGITNKDIQSHLSREFGKKLSASATSGICRLLKVEGVISVAKEGIVNKFHSDTS